MVAVKQLSVESHQGKRQFIAEIATISAVQHRNLVKLYGCCIEGNRRILVYEYLENKSVDQALFGMERIKYHSFLITFWIHKNIIHTLLAALDKNLILYSTRKKKLFGLYGIL